LQSPGIITKELLFKVKLYYLSFSLFFLFQSVLSQNYQCYDQLTSEDGLSQSTVNCILQDRDGFIWMGTQDGLNMFDGYNFTYYQNQPSDSNSLSNNYILSICEDQEGFLWIGTMSGGLNKFDKYSNTFKVFQHTDDPASISDNSIWTVMNDDLDNIWTGTNYGINVFNKRDQSFTKFRYSENDTNSIPSDVVMNIFQDNHGIIWIGSNKGLAKLNKKESNFIRIEKGDSDLIIWNINQLSENKLIIGANSGLWELNTNTEKFTKIESHNEETVWTIFPENDRIWFGTRSGIKILDNTKLKYENISIKSKNGEEPEELNSWCLMKDKSGFIWAGTDNGIFKIKSGEPEFRTINANPDNKPTISLNSVNTILVDQLNTLWIGTEGGGLNRLDENSNQLDIYKANNFINNSLSNNNVWALLEDKQGMIWVGTYGGGLNAFDRNTETFTVYKRNKNVPGSISNNRILALHEDAEGDIWIGTRSGGLNRYDRSTDTFETFLTDPDDSSSISSNTVLSIAEDTLGNLWIGTFEGGINILNPSTKKFQCFKTDPLNPNSISNNNVWVILFDRQNKLWLGTQGGLNLSANPYAGELEFMHFTTKQGIPSNVIFGLAEDANNDIWMSTFRGIARLEKTALQTLIDKGGNISTYLYDPFNPIFSVFDASDGLQSNEFNQGAYFQSKTGEIYFGGPKGLNIFHPDSLKVSQFMPPVVLTGFKIFNKEVLIRPEISDNKKNKIIREKDQYFLPGKISYLEEIEISYRESVFSFDFASLDYSLPSKNQYAYLMEGFDMEWNYIGNKTSATYTNLDAGHYIFRVRGTNADGIWSDQEASLEVTIIPPFWKTTWFILLVVIFILAIVFLVIRGIFQTQKKKAEAEREKIELQLKTIKNQMDPHFAFNAINMIGSLVYKNDPDTVYDYFSRFARLIRSTLQDSEKISRPLKDELEFVKNYVEIQKTRFKGKFDFLLNIAKNTDLEIEVPKMVIQTHAENAIKHGLMHKNTDGLLQINIDQLDNVLTISIEDNGIGRAEAAKVSRGSTGKGMNIIKQIFTLYNKIFNYKIDQQVIDLTDEKGNPKGTKVVLTIEKSND